MRKIQLLVIILSFLSCELEFVENSLSEKIDKNKIIELVNDVRKKGCKCGETDMPPAGKLSWNNELERAALFHSIDMHTNNFFNHTGSNGSDFVARIQLTDFKGYPGGENIAAGYPDEEAVINGWFNSPGHCMNIMWGSQTEFAVGRSGIYWTMVLGSK